jgi:hypothetical protein
MRTTMSNLLFFSRSCAYRHAARAELRKARLLPRGPQRDPVRKRARALRDLARNEAWLEGRSFRIHRGDVRLTTTAAPLHPIGYAQALG